LQRFRNIALGTAATLVFCLVSQKILVLLLPYALKRFGGELFKRLMKTYKTLMDYMKLLNGFLSTLH
jgi:hypothetical protein